MISRNCQRCTASFQITDDDLRFYEKVSPVFGEQVYSIPAPSHCPDCRQQRRLALCNERFFYPGTCGLCKKSTLSEHPLFRNQPIYCRECWHSDKWDARDFGKDFDFTRPFFDQILELKRATPSPALNIQGTNDNSEFIHYAGSCKNCYLIMHADFCEDCYYGYGFKKNTSCVDGFYNLHCELCYDCVDVRQSYDLKGSQDCINCHSSAFLRDCVGCKNCFLCVGLRGKEYCFENQQLSKEEYLQKMAQIDTGSYTQYQQHKKRLKELEKQHSFKEFQGTNLENSFGNNLYNCKDTWFSFDCEDVEGGKFCYQVVLGAKDVYDIYQYGTNLQQSYECSISGENSYRLFFCDNCHVNSSDLFYCWYMERSKNCFGCVNMQQAQYCILNKQYTKEEYEKLVPQIIEHMKKTGEFGEFFPMSHSPHGYNRSSAQMYYPLTKEQVLAQGLTWDDYDAPRPQVQKVLDASNISDNIKDVSDDILTAAVECEVTKRLFKITPKELKFYRQQKVPLPRRCPDQRHLDRFSLRNPRKFWNRSCSQCQKNFWTTYSSEITEKVLCEPCYLARAY
ncbi:MAG: hypothetical protein AAB551_02530 [Patescibacteria group bacterium]